MAGPHPSTRPGLNPRATEFYPSEDLVSKIDGGSANPGLPVTVAAKGQDDQDGGRSDAELFGQGTDAAGQDRTGFAQSEAHEAGKDIVRAGNQDSATPLAQAGLNCTTGGGLGHRQVPYYAGTTATGPHQQYPMHQQYGMYQQHGMYQQYAGSSHVWAAMPAAGTAQAYSDGSNTMGAPNRSAQWSSGPYNASPSTFWDPIEHNASGIPTIWTPSQDNPADRSVIRASSPYNPREESKQQMEASVAAYRAKEEDAKGFEDDEVFIPNIQQDRGDRTA